MPTLRRLAAVAFLCAGAAHAQTPAGTAGPVRPAPAASAPAARGAMTEAEVRKIDKAQGKLTLRHAEIPSLEMPAMTMVFKVADPKMLDALKDGDKVRFSADRVNGVITVTAIEPLPR